MDEAFPTIKQLIGYARSSPQQRHDDMQVEALRAAGCSRVYQEDDRSDGDARPVLSRLLAKLSTGDMLIVVSLDRVARSAAHLLQMVEQLDRQGACFRSLRDPIDTSIDAGRMSLEVVRSIVQLEKAVMAERTRAGIRKARAQGKLPGNPGLRNRSPDAIRAISTAREKAFLAELIVSAPAWLPTVRQLRPRHNWENIARVLSYRGQDWTVERLRRAVHRMVREKLAESELLVRSPRRPPEDQAMEIAAAISIADPNLSVRDIAARLDEIGEHPPEGKRKWQVPQVRHLLEEAYRFGLLRS